MSARNNQGKLILVCPIRNEEKSVGKLLESLRAQSYQNWVIHFFDNNSTDCTVQIIQTIANGDARIKLSEFEQFVSINANFNRALDEIIQLNKFDYVGFVGGDDYFLETHYLSELIRHLEKDFAFAVPKFLKETIDEKIIVEVSTFDSLTKIKFLNRLKLAWDSNYLNIFYSLFRWEQFKRIVLDKRSVLSENLVSDWWFVNTALRVITLPPTYVESATYVKGDKGIRYDSGYYHGNEKANKTIGTPLISLGYNLNTFLIQKLKLICYNIVVVPTLIIASELRRISWKLYPEFLLLWIIMVISRINNAFLGTYLRTKRS